VRGHVNAETLAAFREGLLSRRKAARVSAHLAACSRCAGLDAQLTEVSALLTRSTAPPMPDALTARIEAAIAAEAAARAATPADGTVAAPATGTGARARDGAARPSGQRAGRGALPPAGPRRSILALRVAAVTAAVAVVAGGGYGVAKLLSGSPGSGTASSGAAAPNISAKGAPQMSAGRRAPATGSGAAAAGTASTARVVSSGTDYQPGRLKAQVSAVLTRQGTGAAEGAGPGPSPGNLRASPRQPACIPRVTGGKRPLLADLAKYQGRPATVIVVPAGRPGTLRVLVVAGGCTAAKSHILATTTLPAPG
jgi:hypothetical protein